MGGAIGTGAHGSTVRYNASISSQVVSLTIVDGTGNVQTISDPDDLRSFRLNLGLLGKTFRHSNGSLPKKCWSIEGIVVDITLYTVPVYKTMAHNYIVPDEALTNGVGVNWAKTTDQIAFYWLF